jgi:hypothetical protein
LHDLFKCDHTISGLTFLTFLSSDGQCRRNKLIAPVAGDPDTPPSVVNTGYRVAPKGTGGRPRALVSFNMQFFTQ